MAEYLVELYVSREDSAAVESSARRAGVAAEELTAKGVPVRYVRAIFVPEDETCFFLYEAASVEAVRRAARRAGLKSERITKALGALKGGEACLRTGSIPRRSAERPT
jgi:hypothetical protein